MAYLWGWFIELSKARQFTDQGQALPFTYTEIRSWRDLTKVEPTPFDIQVMKQLDILSLNSKKP